MRHQRWTREFARLAGLGLALGAVWQALAAPPDRVRRDPWGDVRTAAATQPPVVQPTPPGTAPTPITQERLPSPQPTPMGGGGVGDPWGTLSADPELASAIQDITRRQLQISNPATGGAQASTRATTDAGSLLGKSLSSAGVEIQKRSPVSNEPRVRGYRVGEVVTHADGAFYFPARQDLDTMLSKIDSGIIRDIITIQGPYSARYGPGFSFIDIATTATPRSESGPEWHGRSSLNYQTNGDQWYARQSLWGGNVDWGFRLGYGHRTGNDYDTGDGIDIPASFNSRDFDAAIGADLTDEHRIELSYLHLDQTNSEYPGQIFDIDFLVTDGYTLRYTMTDHAWFDQLAFDSWYNRTHFEGNAQRSGKRRQIPELNGPLSPGGILNFVGFTDVDEMSTGFRVAGTWGTDEEAPQVTLGVDMRYLEQELNELDAFDAGALSSGGLANFPIPRSHASNPGLFIDATLPMDAWRFTAGSRVDLVSTNTEGSTVGRTAAQIHTALGTDQLDQDFGLWAAYLTAEYDMNDVWTVFAKAGHAERAPTLTELYAVDPFLAILQQGFTQVRGNPQLHRERLWQMDLGMKADYESLRAGVTGFYAWVHDYITYQARNQDLIDAGITNGLAVNFVNTDLATLSGGEIYTEYDWSDWLTPFATMRYVEGRDHARDSRGVIAGSEDEPLPGIAPLSSRLGFRVHEVAERPAWSVEFSARVVDNQDRVATSLLELPTAGFTTYDLRGYWRASDALLLVSGVENLTDKDYREHLDLRTGQGVFQPGINFYFGVEYQF
jgi:outer membrane receptor protein involved in Fe transport